MHPGVMWIFSGSRCHCPCGRVTARSCSELVRARWPSWFERPVSRPRCSHMEKELGRAVCVRGDDDLLGGVRVLAPMAGTLSPAWMASVYFVAASVERDEVMHLVQFMNLGPQLLRQIQVVRRQLVLCVVTTADVAVPARDAAAAPRSDAPEVGVLGLHARAPEVHAHRGVVEGLPSSDLARGLLQRPIHVGRHVGVANDPEHPGGLVDAWRQLVGPVGDVRPLRRVEELLRRDVEGVRVYVRTAAHARPTQDQDIVEVLDPLNPVELRRWEPQELRQIPLRLRDVLVLPAPAGLHDADPVALLRRPQGGNAPAEARADDDDVVVEARHRSLSPLPVALAAQSSHVRPASRVVTSCRSQLFPSGSLNVA